MDIKQMRYFIEICRCGSMSKAAENLYISQQGLSNAVRRLELELNCDLFYRKANGLVLTEAGEIFKKEAEIIIRRVDYLINYYASAKNVERISVAGTVNAIVRMPVKLQQLLLSQVDDAFKIDYTEAWTSDCENMVLDGRAGIALVYGPCDSERFDITSLALFQQLFIVNKQSPLASRSEVSVADLDNIPLIIPSCHCRPGITIRALFERANVKLNIAIDCDRPRQTIDLVSRNPNLVGRILKEDILTEDLTAIHPLTLSDDEFKMPFCMITKKGHQLSVAEKCFKSMVINLFSVN